MPARILLAALAVLLLAIPAFAKDEPADDQKPAVKEATDKEFAHELKIFKKDFETVDVDFRLDALIRFAKCVHKKTANELLKILYKDKDPYVRAEAAKGLQFQVPHKDTIGRKTAKLLEDDKLDPMILRELILSIGELRYTRSWELIAELISHDDDKVVIACFSVIEKWKELRAWREMQMFWDMYPGAGKWATGTVTVDTGAAGDVDARAAKAKWKAKYGNKAKQRPRPDCVKALQAAILAITKEELKKPAEFREWCSNHKREIKAAERKRDR